MLNVDSVDPAIIKLKAAQADLRTAMAAAAADGDIPMEKVKQLTTFHDHVSALARDIELWKTQNVKK